MGENNDLSDICSNFATNNKNQHMKLFDVYPLFNVNIVKGQGCKVWDDQGQNILTSMVVMPSLVSVIPILTILKR